MNLWAYTVDWSRALHELRRQGSAFQPRDADWCDYSVTEEILGGDSVIINEEASMAVERAMPRMSKETADAFQAFGSGFLVLLHGGHAYKPPKDFGLENHDVIIASFAPHSVAEYVRRYQLLNFTELRRTIADNPELEENQAIRSADDLQDYLARWGRLLQHAVETCRGIIICAG